MDELDALWQKFLSSGHINDYINYKLYLRKKEETQDETDSPKPGSRIKNKRL